MKKRLAGITLIELLIGMTLSLLLIGGAFSVYLSNKQTSEARQQLDSRQEALRFASYTINRIVKNGAGIDGGSTATELAIAFNRSNSSPDCLGNTDVSDVVDRFRFNATDKTLTCNDQLLLSGIDQLSFAYLSSDSSGKLWVVPAEEATLVKVDLSIGALNTSFSATSRASLIKTELAEEIAADLPVSIESPDTTSDDVDSGESGNGNNSNNSNNGNNGNNSNNGNNGNNSNNSNNGNSGNDTPVMCQCTVKKGEVKASNNKVKECDSCCKTSAANKVTVPGDFTTQLGVCN